MAIFKIMKTRWIEVIIIVLALGLLSLCFAGWSNTKPADNTTWNTAMGEIRDNWDALEAVFGVDLATATFESGVGNWIDVRHPDFGAIGDDTNDDSTAIQAALDSLSATGGTIFLAPLTFRIDTGLVIPVGVHIQIIGSGSNSVLHYTGTLNAITATGTAGNRAWGTYRDFKILGNINMDIGLSITWGTRKTSVENVSVETFNGSGIYILDSWGLQLSHCSVVNGTGNGIYIDCTDGFGSTTVIGCNCENITGYGLLAEKTAIQIIGGLYETNTISNIRLVGCRGFLISGVYIENLEATGDCHGIVVTGEGVGSSSHSRGGSIIGCEIERGSVETGSAYSIYIHKAYGVHIAGNHINPHADDAGMAAIPHIYVATDCHDIEIGQNDYRGTSFTNVCAKVQVVGGSTGVSILNHIAPLADNATPDVSEGNIYETSGTTTITDFDFGTKGQPLTIFLGSSKTFDFTTAQDDDHNLDGSSADITADAGDIIRFLNTSGTTWRLISYSDASVDNN